MKSIPLTRGQVAIVDDEDFELVNQFKWTASEAKVGFYAVRSVKIGSRWTQQYLHHFLLGRVRTDHKNGNKLDFRRSNLRPATRSQNARSFKTKAECATSQFRGVALDSQTGQWRAKIRLGAQTKHLGRFLDEVDAARAYDRAAKIYFGAFASLNGV